MRTGDALRDHRTVDPPGDPVRVQWSIVYLGNEPFAIIRDAYLKAVVELNGDMLRLTEWVEANGVDLNLVKQLRRSP